MKGKKLGARISKLVLMAVVLYYVGLQVATNWDTARGYDWSLDLVPLLGSIGLSLGTYLVFSACWRSIIGRFGHRISFPISFRIAYLSSLGRYIPGRFWQAVGMVYLARREGVQGEQVFASFVIVHLFSIPASFLVYALASQLEPRIFAEQMAAAGTASPWVLTGLMLAACLVLVLAPQPILRASNFVLVRFGRQPAAFALGKREALAIFAGYFAGWISYGLGFWLFLVALLGDQGPGPVAAIGLFNAAFMVGYLTLFAPGGLGPRELVMGLLLAPFVGPIAPAVAVVARIWAIGVEAVATLTALAVKGSDAAPSSDLRS